MKKFIVKIAVYIFPVVVLLIALQFFVDNGLHKLENDDTYSDWNKIINGSIDIDVAILGSSRAWVHINPETIEQETTFRAYNLGVDGAALYLQRAKWLSYINHNTPPHYVIQEVGVFTMDMNKELYGKEQYLPYLNNSEIFDVISSFDKNLLFERYIPFIKYRGYSKSVMLGLSSFFGIDKNTTSCKIKGFEGKRAEWDNYETVFKKQLETSTIKSNGFTIDDNEALRSLINECKERNIHIIFVHTPHYHELLQIIPQQQEFIDYFTKLAEQDSDIEFWDFSIMDNVSFNRDYFYNATHLNYKGAAIISDSIANRLKNLALEHEKLN